MQTSWRMNHMLQWSNCGKNLCRNPVSFYADLYMTQGAKAFDVIPKTFMECDNFLVSSITFGKPYPQFHACAVSGEKNKDPLWQVACRIRQLSHVTRSSCQWPIPVQGHDSPAVLLSISKLQSGFITNTSKKYIDKIRTRCICRNFELVTQIYLIRNENYFLFKKIH